MPESHRLDQPDDPGPDLPPDAEGVAYDPRAPQNALSMRHLVHKYFKHQKDLVPAFVDEVLAPYDAAAVQLKQKAAAPATTGQRHRPIGLQKKELIAFCL